MFFRALITATAVVTSPFLLGPLAVTITAQGPVEKVTWTDLARKVAVPRQGPTLVMFWENDRCSPCQETLNLLVKAGDLGTLSLMPVAIDQLATTTARPELETAVASTAGRFRVPAPWLFAVPGTDAQSYAQYFGKLHPGLSPDNVPAYMVVDKTGTVVGWHEAFAALEIVTPAGEVFAIDEPDQAAVASFVVGRADVNPLLKAVAVTWRASVQYSQLGRTMTSKVARNPKNYADTEPARFVREVAIRSTGLRGVKEQASLPVSISGAVKNGIVSVAAIALPLTR